MHFYLDILPFDMLILLFLIVNLAPLTMQFISLGVHLATFPEHFPFASFV